MAAAGFIPVVGWAGRAVKGGSAIVKTAKGMNAANHMLDAYKSTKAMDILNKTEKGIYGLYTANSAWEFGSGRDMFGNKLTEEQRQNALWNGLTMGLVGGAAKTVDRVTNLPVKGPYSNKYRREQLLKGRQNFNQTMRRQVSSLGRKEIPVLEVRAFNTPEGFTMPSFTTSNKQVKDFAPTFFERVEELSSSKTLLQGEGKVGTYEDLIDSGTRGDNITPHHMPSAKYMKTNAEIAKNDGVSMNMEHPHPGKGGRHRLTETYGLTGEKLNEYLNLSPRQALYRDIVDVRRIYQEAGLYTSDIRKGLLEVIRLNKSMYPELFDK